MKTEIINLDEIQETIIAFANGDFRKRLKISEDRDARDSIVSGVNMLGEELELTMISRDYFGSIYNAVTDILIVTDLNGIISDVNKAAEEKLGIHKDDLINKNANILVSDRSLRLRRTIMAAFQSGKAHYKFETTFADPKGFRFPVSCSISKIVNRHNEHDGYLIIAKDITDEKNREQHLLKVIVSTQEKERKRLAYDLHDSLGQELNAIKMYLNSLDYIDKSSSNFSRTFDECKQMLDQSINTVRDLSFDLMPKSLENGNLCYAVEQLANNLGGICQIKCDFLHENLGLDKEVQILIYRVFQEFISNSMKHAKATCINLKVNRVNSRVIFALSDNGVGFVEENIVAGNGIHNMQSRLEAINANYKLKSQLNEGTQLKFLLQL